MRHGMQQVPAFLHHKPWELMHGVVHAMLLALVLLSILALRYPLKMLPLLFWEIIMEDHMASRSGTARVAEPRWTQTPADTPSPAS